LARVSLHLEDEAEFLRCLSEFLSDRVEHEGNDFLPFDVFPPRAGPFPDGMIELANVPEDFLHGAYSPKVSWRTL
jgi:hypothetical protein